MNGPLIARSGELVVLLAITLNITCLGANKRSRAFNAQFETVWTAAVDVAHEAFLPDRTSKADGRLRFRTGPFRGYRFEVVIVGAGAGKTRVEMELLTNLYRVEKGEKDAWRRGDQYLRLLAERLHQSGQR